MKIEASLEEWRKLYEIAIKVKEQKPWEDENVIDFIEIREGKDKALCNIAGRGGMFYGLMAYCDDFAIDNFLYLVANGEHIPQSQHERYQNCIVCNFADRKEVPNEEYKLIKELGLKFRGKNEWIFFSKFEKDYDAGSIDRKDVLKMTKILEQVYICINDIKNGKYKYTDDGSEVPARVFDKNKKVWITQKGDLEEFRYDYPVPFLEDEVLVHRLKKAPKTDINIELDIIILPVPVPDFKREKDALLSMAVIVDADEEQIIKTQFINPGDDRVDIVFEIIIPYILQFGKPNMFIVRDKDIGSLIMGLCKSIGVNIALSPELLVLDDFLDELTNDMFSRF